MGYGVRVRLILNPSFTLTPILTLPFTRGEGGEGKGVGGWGEELTIPNPALTLTLTITIIIIPQWQSANTLRKQGGKDTS
jgi:hypothetical protein